MTFRKVGGMFALRSTQKMEDHPVRTSVTVYSIHSQVLSVTENGFLHPLHENTLFRERERERGGVRDIERTLNGQMERACMTRSYSSPNIGLNMSRTMKQANQAECIGR